MPLVVPFRTSVGTQERRDVLLVRVVTDDVDGWGECVAPEEPLYSSEYVEAAHHATEHHLVPRLLADPAVTASDVAGRLAPVKGHRMAKAALEMAVLDAELQARGESFAEHLGGVRDAVDAGVSVGIQPSISALVETVDGYLGEGYRRIKLKIKPGWDIEPVRAIRQQFGDEVLLQVDANAAYDLEDVRHLSQLDDFGLLLIEQPLPEDDLSGHADLARRISTPICLDESITSSHVASDAIALGACSVINIKAGRVGGYLEARRIHDVCAMHEVRVWCGGMLETGLGRAANIALAALPNFVLPGDLSASDRYFSEDLTEPFVLADGRLAVPRGGGLGVEPRKDVLERVTISVQRFRPN